MKGAGGVGPVVSLHSGGRCPKGRSRAQGLFWIAAVQVAAIKYHGPGGLSSLLILPQRRGLGVQDQAVGSAGFS